MEDNTSECFWVRMMEGRGTQCFCGSAACLHVSRRYLHTHRCTHTHTHTHTHTVYVNLRTYAWIQAHKQASKPTHVGMQETNTLKLTSSSSSSHLPHSAHTQGAEVYWYNNIMGKDKITRTLYSVVQSNTKPCDKWHPFEATAEV